MRNSKQLAEKILRMTPEELLLKISEARAASAGEAIIRILVEAYEFRCEELREKQKDHGNKEG